MTTSRSTRALIAQMKIQKLREQRDRLQADYDAIISRAESARDTKGRMEAFYEGLRKLRLAGEPVHPTLPDLSATLVGIRLGADRAAATWEKRLLDELERGRNRSEAVYAFGALLEQATSAREVQPAAGELSSYVERVGRATSSPPPMIGKLEALFDSDGLGRFREKVDKVFADGLGVIVADTEDAEERKPPVDDRRLLVDTDLLISAICDDPERSPELRQEAEQFRQLSPEGLERGQALKDAMKMVAEDAANWRWPTEGVDLRPVQTADRVRFHPDVDLVTLLLLQIVGEWMKDVMPAFWTGHANWRTRLDRLLEIDAPEIIVDNERKRLDEQMGLFNDARVSEPTTHGKSVLIAREVEIASIWSTGKVAGGHYGYEGSAPMIRLVNAEVAYRRQRGEPVFVVRTDIEDFFPTVDHRLILELLERLGVSEHWRDFVRAYLEIPLRVGDDIVTPRRGLPLGFTLSRLLADMVLGAVELKVRRAAPIHTIRMVDDFVIIGSDPEEVVTAWNALSAGVEQCGLSLQAAKTGATAIGAPLPAGLPTAPARWNILSLTADGWHLHEAAFDNLLAQTRQEIERAPSVFAAVTVLNAKLKWLVEATMASSHLGWNNDDHLAFAAGCVHRFCAELVDSGVESWLRARIDEQCSPKYALPTGWLYWPVTAGGLGLFDPILALAPLAAERPMPPEHVDDFDPEIASEKWGQWYRKLLSDTEPTKPRADSVSEALVTDFIRRGGELRGTTQSELSTYWRWVLATHGPEITESFGTFRFLSQRLVPLDLIRGRGSSEAADPDKASARTPAPV